jgi:hypothetical protein
LTINQSHALKSYKHFAKTCNRFDKRINVKTYIFKSTLRTMNKEFFKKDYNKIINSMLLTAFSDSNELISNQLGPVAACNLQKLNTIYTILADLKRGIGIKYPLSLNYFKNKKWGAHPGNSRLFFENYYTPNVTAMITDYRGTLKKNYPKLEFKSLKDGYFDVTDVCLNLRSTEGGAPNSIIKPSGTKVIEFKELHAGIPATLADPTLYNPPRSYRLDGDKFYVCDELVLIKSNNIWEFA